MAEVDAQPVWSDQQQNRNDDSSDKELTDIDFSDEDEDEDKTQCLPKGAVSKIPCHEAVNNGIHDVSNEDDDEVQLRRKASVGNPNVANGNSMSESGDEVVSIVGILGKDHDKVCGLVLSFSLFLVQ